MKLEDIGFYTLSDQRAMCSSHETDLERCEIILTDRCNFKCPYCRGLKEGLKGDMPWDEAVRTVDLWIEQGLQNVRFSGGEPTLYKRLDELVAKCKAGGVKHIAISSNGSAKREVYEKLLAAGANDFSISLDSGCCSIGDDMAGGVGGSWQKVVDTIRYLSSHTYVTVGMVFTEENVGNCLESVMFADSLGVADIRVIPAAQFNEALVTLKDLPQEVLDRHPILAYRIHNVNNDVHVRGASACDSNKCRLALDDMAVAGGENGAFHFPCIIYMREGGDPIGRLTDDVRLDRKAWVDTHDTHKDPICSGMCLDVCVAYNNRAAEGRCPNPTCDSGTGMKYPRGLDPYCEDCGYPDDDFGA